MMLTQHSWQKLLIISVNPDKPPRKDTPLDQIILPQTIRENFHSFAEHLQVVLGFDVFRMDEKKQISQFNRTGPDFDPKKPTAYVLPAWGKESFTLQETEKMLEIFKNHRPDITTPIFKIFDDQIDPFNKINDFGIYNEILSPKLKLDRLVYFAAQVRQTLSYQQEEGSFGQVVLPSSKSMSIANLDHKLIDCGFNLYIMDDPRTLRPARGDIPTFDPKKSTAYLLPDWGSEDEFGEIETSMYLDFYKGVRQISPRPDAPIIKLSPGARFEESPADKESNIYSYQLPYDAESTNYYIKLGYFVRQTLNPPAQQQVEQKNYCGQVVLPESNDVKIEYIGGKLSECAFAVYEMDAQGQIVPNKERPPFNMDKPTAYILPYSGEAYLEDEEPHADAVLELFKRRRSANDPIYKTAGKLDSENDFDASQQIYKLPITHNSPLSKIAKFAEELKEQLCDLSHLQGQVVVLKNFQDRHPSVYLLEDMLTNVGCRVFRNDVCVKGGEQIKAHEKKSAAVLFAAGRNFIAGPANLGKLNVPEEKRFRMLQLYSSNSKQYTKWELPQMPYDGHPEDNEQLLRKLAVIAGKIKTAKTSDGNASATGFANTPARLSGGR